MSRPLTFGADMRRRQLVPDLKRLSFIGTTSILATAEFSALQSVADQFGFEIVRHPLGGLDDIEGAVAASLKDDVAGLHGVLGRGAFRVDRGDHDALPAGAGDVAGRATDRPRRGVPRYPLHAQARPLPVHSSIQCCSSL
jgi:hypothetical protein